VVSKNLQRRHLNESQRAMAAARLAKLRLGDNQHAQICAPSQTDAAEMVGVSRRRVQYAREMIDSGSPGLVAAVDQGQIAVSVAAKLADLSQEAQAAAVSKPEKAPHTRSKRVIRARTASGRNDPRVAGGEVRCALRRLRMAI